jgi:hypothetical protein
MELTLIFELMNTPFEAATQLPDSWRSVTYVTALTLHCSKHRITTAFLLK